MSVQVYFGEVAKQIARVLDISSAAVEERVSEDGVLLTADDNLKYAAIMLCNNQKIILIHIDREYGEYMSTSLSADNRLERTIQHYGRIGPNHSSPAGVVGQPRQVTIPNEDVTRQHLLDTARCVRALAQRLQP